MAKRQSTFSRRGLHRLECAGCESYVYATVSSLERHGIPSCACGSEYMPDELELAGLLGVEAPVLDEYRRELSSVLHGQASHGMRGRVLRDPSMIAAQRVESRRRERARSNRLGALLPAPEPMPF